MADRSPSRIEDARRRASRAKRALGVGAAAGFLAVAGLAYASHPGASATSATSTDDSTVQVQDDSTFDFGSGSLAPSSGVQPQAQTSVS
jgi:hypothetical protein